jgi:hypothetical protein
VEPFKAIEPEVIKETHDPPCPLEGIEGVKSYIDQLHAVDEGSYSFRYAVTPRDKATILQT